MAITASRGVVLAWRAHRKASLPIIVIALLVPVIRFAPRYARLAYDDFVAAFVGAVMERWPHVLLQWEDFARDNATRLLQGYRDRLCTFNDDIQGTAVVTTGTLLAAVNVTGVPLTEHRIAVLGGGSAGIGICSLLLKAMLADGLPEAEARSFRFP